VTTGAEPHDRCAVLARSSGEPVAGTAPLAPRWVCLEHRGSWPHDVDRHPDPAVAAFAARAAAAGLRLLLVRRHGRRLDDRPARVFLADTGAGTPTTGTPTTGTPTTGTPTTGTPTTGTPTTGTPTTGTTATGTTATGTATAGRLTTCTVAGPSELAALPLPGPGQPLPGAPLTEPLLLVCTHGRRDRCCALEGRALAAALTAASEPRVWECSHLGGHRFAPTALVLPTGYLYGNLDLASAIAARKAAGAGEVETERCRGRCTWSPAGQVAELTVRAATGIRDADALRVQPDAGDTVLVTARTGRRWLVEVERVELGGYRPTSCGAGPAPIVPVRARGVRALP
jgi:Sucrase/ferredoxin-like